MNRDNQTLSVNDTRFQTSNGNPTPKDAPGDVPDISGEYKTIGLTPSSVGNKQSQNKWDRL